MQTKYCVSLWNTAQGIGLNRLYVRRTRQLPLDFTATISGIVVRLPAAVEAAIGGPTLSVVTTESPKLPTHYTRGLPFAYRRLRKCAPSVTKHKEPVLPGSNQI